MCFAHGVKRVCTLDVLFEGDKSTLDVSGVTIRYRSSTFAIHDLLGIFDAADSRTKVFFDVCWLQVRRFKITLEPLCAHTNFLDTMSISVFLFDLLYVISEDVVLLDEL